MKRGTPDLWVDNCPTCGTERFFTPFSEDQQTCGSCPRPQPSANADNAPRGSATSQPFAASEAER